MYKVVKRSCPIFGNGPYVCEFICDTASDISTLPTSISEGTGGKKVYDNQKCASGSIATVAENGKGSKKYILNNQNTWCPYSVSEGSSIAITVDSSLSDVSKNPVENKVVTAAINNKAAKTDIPTSLPANGGNAATVNNHTVESDVPANAVFTDTWRGIQDSLTSDSAVDSLSANQGKILNEKVEQNKTDISQLFNITKGGDTVSNESSYTLENAVDYPLLGLSLYGRSSQDGIPSPDAPVDIVSVGDNGFDIITKDDTHFNILSVRDNGGEIITKQPVSDVGKNGETKQFIVSASGSGLRYQWWQNVNNGKGWVIMNTEGARQPIFTIPVADFRNGYRYRCVVTDSNGNSETSNEVTLYVVSNDCEITTSSIVTDALPLCGIPVSSGGNYTDSNGQQWICDELIYNADGTGKIIKRTATIMLDGSDDESYQLGSATDIYAPFSVLNVVSPVAYTMQIKSNVTDKVNMTQATADSFAIHCGISLNILFGIDMGVTTIEGARAWLSSHHTTIIYPLATPQEIKLTAAEMTALSQLHTYSGITNIFNSGGADMDVKYCINKSLSECVLPITIGLQKQIDELQDSILSPGPLTIPGSYAETIIGPIITEGDE